MKDKTVDKPDANPVFFHSCLDETCKCQCPDGPCGHKWDGWIDLTDEDGNINGGSAVCSKCGLPMIAHDMKVMP